MSFYHNLNSFFVWAEDSNRNTVLSKTIVTTSRQAARKEFIKQHYAYRNFRICVQSPEW